MPRRLGRFFKPAARYPADPRAVFILALSVFSGLTALAFEGGPETLEALLPKWGVYTWGVLLVLGSVVTLAGMLFQTVNGIITEQIGSVLVGSTTIFYSGLALWVLDSGAIQPVSIILAWGLSCFVRWGQLQSLLNHAHRQQIHEAAVKAAQEHFKRGQRDVEDRIERGERGFQGDRGFRGFRGQPGPKGDDA